MLIDELSNLKQRLINTIPTSLGVKQYIPVTIEYQDVTYNLTLRVAELSPGQKSNYLAMGVVVNQETRVLSGIPFSVPLDAVRYGKYMYQGVQAEVEQVYTNNSVDYTVMVQEYR